jgi:hypothetical protein
LTELSDVIDHARYKSFGGGRIRDPETERIRLKYSRVIIQAQAERRKMLVDKEMIRLKQQIKEHPRSTVTWKQKGIRHDAENNRVRLSEGRKYKPYPNRARE